VQVHRARPLTLVGPALALALTLARPTNAVAVDPFEIQVYDGTADPAGQPGLELHLNGVPRGIATAEPPELPPNHQAHLTLEPSWGLTPSWEIGAYVQTAVLADGAFAFAGAKLRVKLVTPPGWRAALRLGCNFEVSWVPSKFEADRWGSEIRPIVAWENARWSLAANPIVELSFTGAAPAFAPALMALFKLEGRVSLGLEYYADVGPIPSPSPLSQQQHYLFEVVNLLAVRDFELNAGIGEGLTRGSNDLVAKVIVGYQFSALSWARPGL
jgi:hypothetical protein